MLISDTVLDYTQENDTLEDWISNIKSSSDHALKNALFELDNISGNVSTCCGLQFRSDFL